MNDRRKRRALPKRIVTTLGELISAAYEAADGPGRKQRIERAAGILTAPDLARRMSRPLRFV